MAKRVIKVAVALSGGVDSAVSAALLIEGGFDVTGIFMKTYEPEELYVDECTWKEEQNAARSVAEHLGIPFFTWNFEREYTETVLKYFFSELKNGRTPNPDVMCNQDIKFGHFLNKALKENFNYIATGHYAHLTCGARHSYELRRGKDKKKDQSYFLCRVPQQVFSRVLFPVGCMEKSEVRKKAHLLHLPNAERKDSQGICFLGKINVNTFIQRHISLQPGDIKTVKGDVIGKHSGLALYTIGQREGIRIGGTKEPYYVIDKNPATQTLIVVEGKEHPLLYANGCILENIVWVAPRRSFKKSYIVQIRYQQKPQKAFIKKSGSSNLEVAFSNPQWAVTPGQLCALYDQDQCIASGIIKLRVA
ncbi:MAG: tRNA 2-thiouridine(34) synthase MnmA [Patescibacteria group bacterium]|jgi:tRNA-specific 2-thiouridylase